MISSNIENPAGFEEISNEKYDSPCMKKDDSCVVGMENEMARWRPCINEVKGIIRKYNPSPTQLRYIFKKTREETQLFIPTRPKPLPKCFMPAEVFHLFETARGMSDTHSLLVQFTIQTGCRIKEVRDADLRDIKRNECMLHIVKGKGGKGRIVPIGPSLIEKVFLYCKPRDKGSIFVNSKTQKPLSVRRLQQIFQEVCEKAGFGVRNPHTARHTFATILLSKGFRLEEIQAFMGHSSKVTTEIYAKLMLTPEVKEKYLLLFP